MDSIDAARRQVSFWDGKDPTYDASILMTAYRAEGTLREAIGSIFAQKVAPRTHVQLVIGVDLSPDDTLGLARRLARESPEWLTIDVLENTLPKITLNGRVTGRSNFFNCYAYLRGRIVLYLNCDDYWITETKLQSQIDHTRRSGRASCTTLRTEATPLEAANEVSDMLSPFENGTTVLFSSFAMPYVRLGHRRFWWTVGFLDLPIIGHIYERFGIDRLMNEKTYYRLSPKGAWSTQTPLEKYRIILNAAWQMALWGPYRLPNRIQIVKWALRQRP